MEEIIALVFSVLALAISIWSYVESSRIYKRIYRKTNGT